MIPNYIRAMQVDVPEAEYDGMQVRRFEVPENYPTKWRDIMDGREVPAGWYTGLFEHTGLATDVGADIRGWRIWMSDTPAERRDHLDALLAADRLKARRAAVNGLGLGMVVRGLLSMPHIEHVDVVEIDPRVIKLVQPAYADPRVTIHEADALKPGLFPKGTRWDVAWHDIWPDDGSATCRDEALWLLRSYGRRVRWQGVWRPNWILSADLSGWAGYDRQPWV